MDAHFDVVDQLSPAEQPDDAGWYTHKLDCELDVAVAALRSLVEASLDIPAAPLRS